MDIKEKLQLVLSTSTNFAVTQQENANQKEKLCVDKSAEMEANDLHLILKSLLAESINYRNFKMIAQIREVQRCLSYFDTDGYFQ